MNKISSWWVTGITDSEGNFSINYNSKAKKISASFKVTQKDHSLAILTDLKTFFNCGNINIDNNKFNAYKFTVSKLSYLTGIIIPHFDKYPLVGSKHLDFLDFKEAVSLLYKHSEDNLEKILLIKNKMNKKRPYEERWDYLNKLKFDLKPEWVQAFVDGEGTFQCRIADTTKGVIVNPTLEIAQSSHDIEVLNAIKNFFKVGYLKPKYDIKSLIESIKSRSVSRLIVNQSKVIVEFIDKYPMLTRKHLDFLDWKKLVELKSKGDYKTLEGKENMINIKLAMNKGRLLNSNLLDSPTKLKIIKSSHFSDHNRSYYTNTYINNNKNFKSYLWRGLILFLVVSNLLLFTYVFDLWVYCIKESFLISSFFFLTIFYLDGFSLSESKPMRYYQILIFILFALYIINVCYFGYLWTDDIINHTNIDTNDVNKKNDVTLQGKVVVDQEAGTQIAKGMSNVGNNIGLAGCIGAMAGGVSSAIAKSSLPPVQKVGLIGIGGIVGAALHVGVNSINSHRDLRNLNHSTSTNTSLPKDINKLIDYTGDSSPLNLLLQCINVLDFACFWLIIFLSIQFFFKIYIQDKPELKFLDRMLPSYSNIIKTYIQKLIKINKNMSTFYTISAILLLIISLAGSLYFSWELYNDLDSYVDEYIKSRNK